MSPVVAEKPSSLLWLIPEGEEFFRLYIEKLIADGFKVTICHSLAELTDYAANYPVEKFLLSDLEDANETFHIFAEVMTAPSITPARKLFVSRYLKPKVCELVAGFGYRDIVPTGLNLSEWSLRVKLSLLSHAATHPEVLGGLVQNLLLDVVIPFRLIWASPQHMRLECTLKAPVGAKLVIYGRLVEKLGFDSLQVQVNDRFAKEMHYRFSNALLCSWAESSDTLKKIAAAWKDLEISNSGHQYRVFVATTDIRLRQELYAALRHEQLHLYSTTNTSKIAAEPSYITPDVVFIQKELTQGKYEEVFIDMLEHLAKYTPVIVVGEVSTSEINDLNSLVSKHTLIFVEKIEEKIKARIFDELLVVSAKKEKHVIHFSPKEQLSFGSIRMKGYMKTFHPHMTTVSIPFPLMDYALICLRVDALKDWLGQYLWAKVLKLHPSVSLHGDSAHYQIDCLLIDRTGEQKLQMFRDLAQQSYTLFFARSEGKTVSETALANLNFRFLDLEILPPESGLTRQHLKDILELAPMSESETSEALNEGADEEGIRPQGLEMMLFAASFGALFLLTAILLAIFWVST